MRWSEERYVRVYKRDTADWIALSFDAQALFCLLLRKVDLAGHLELGKQGPKAVAVVLGQVALWESRLKGALDELLADGCVTIADAVLTIPNYVAAQEAVASAKLRARDYRERHSDENVTKRDAPVTKRDASVTPANVPNISSPLVTPCPPSLPSPPSQKDKKEQKTSGEPSASGAVLDLLGPERRVSSAATRAVKDKLTPAGMDTGSITAPTWEAYAAAYRQRYGADPVRNATVNAQIKQLVKRLGEEAPKVAAFYVQHAGAFYAQKGHGVGPLLADCEALRTQWATGTQITAAKARQDERTQANAQGWGALLSEEGRKHGMD